MYFQSKITIFSFLFVLVSAQSGVNQTCPQISSSVTNFNLTNFLGKWYEIERYRQLFETDLICVTVDVSIQNETINIVNTGILGNWTDVNIEGNATQDKDDASKFTVYFPPDFEGEYAVIDTDYDTYSLVYGCQQLGADRLESAWIISRNSTLNDTRIEELKLLLSAFNSSTDLFEKVDQSECSSASQTLLSFYLSAIILLFRFVF